MPGLNKVYLPRPCPVVLHVYFSPWPASKCLEYGLVQGERVLFRPLLSSISGIPAFIKNGKLIFTVAKHRNWEDWGGC